jgi:hypothetical protein
MKTDQSGYLTQGTTWLRDNNLLWFFIEFNYFEKESKNKIPEAFRQEIKEYIGQLNPIEDNYSDYIGKELNNQKEIEDLMATNNLKNM